VDTVLDAADAKMLQECATENGKASHDAPPVEWWAALDLNCSLGAGVGGKRRVKTIPDSETS
jgi:hypothetical protein